MFVVFAISIKPLENFGSRGRIVADKSQVVRETDEEDAVLRAENFVQENLEILFVLLREVVLASAEINDQAEG